jgi:acid phosphatase (class A)
MRRAALCLALLLVATPALALSDAPYITKAEADLTLLLPPPPAKGSAAERADLAAVLAAQKARTPALAAKIEAESSVTVFQFTQVLGPDFTKANLPRVDAFFTKVFEDANALSADVKNVWARPRPYDASPLVKPPGDMIKTTRSLKDGSPTFSFPSGHAAWGVEFAILLADMVPEKKRELLARGWEIGQQRVIGGVHYPTDIEAGRINGTVMVALMLQKPAFRADMAEIKAELRKALKLAP